MAALTQLYPTQIVAHSSLVSPKDKRGNGCVQYSPRINRGSTEPDWMASPRYKIELSEKDFIACSTPTIRQPSDLFGDGHLLNGLESGIAGSDITVEELLQNGFGSRSCESAWDEVAGQGVYGSNLLEEKLNEENQLHLVHSIPANNGREAIKLTSSDMQAKIDELQQELLKKERLSNSEQYHLSQKQNEIADLRSLLQSIHEDVVKKNEETANMEQEIDTLRCQVAALRYQLKDHLDLSSKNNEGNSLHSKLEVQAPGIEASTFSETDLKNFKKEIMETEGFWLLENEQKALKKMDFARRMYLAAVLTARENPGEETLALAAQSRMQLQQLLIQPGFSAPIDGSMANPNLAFQMF